MRSVSFERPAGVCAPLAAVAALLYAVSVAVVSRRAPDAGQGPRLGRAAPWLERGVTTPLRNLADSGNIAGGDSRIPLLTARESWHSRCEAPQSKGAAG